MRQLIAIALASTLSLSALPLSAAAATAPTASIAGIAQSANGQSVANATVQLRNLGIGPLASTTITLANGSFDFTGLAAGNYSIEVVNAYGQVIGTSTAIPVAPGAAVTGVTVMASPAAAPAAASAAAAAGSKHFSKAVIITTAAAAAGIVSVVAVVRDASPSK
jgi:Carboxypeptidase regulatory-like domain